MQHILRPSWIIRRRKYVLIGLLLVVLGGTLLSVALHRTTNTTTNYPLPPSVNNKDSDFKDIISDDFIQQERKFLKKRLLRHSSDTPAQARVRGSHRGSIDSPLNSDDQRESVENRVRSLKTLLGAVVLKDHLFTPKYPGLWKGFSEKKSDMQRMLSSYKNGGDGDNEEENSEHVPKETDSDKYLKTLLADAKQKQERKLERKKLDPKTRLQNGMLKFKAFQKNLLSKMKKAENADYKLESDEVKSHIQSSPLEGDCTSPLCREYLSTEDSSRYQYCKQKAIIEVDTEPQSFIECHFMNGSTRHSVALAGHPASGQKQVRTLLQQVTGLCTGGVHCNVTLRQNGFPGEYIVSGAVLVVESDQLEPCWIGDPCSNHDKSTLSRTTSEREGDSGASVHSAIYLIRNPLDVMRDLWMNREETPWPEVLDEFVASQTLQWQKSVLAWVVDSMDHPVLVVKYEDLRENTQLELKRMLDFLQAPYKPLELEKVALDNEDSEHHLDQRDLGQSPFSEENKKRVLNVVQNTKTSLEEAGLDNTCNLSSYMKQ